MLDSEVVSLNSFYELSFKNDGVKTYHKNPTHVPELHVYYTCAHYEKFHPYLWYFWKKTKYLKENCEWGSEQFSPKLFSWRCL